MENLHVLLCTLMIFYYCHIILLFVKTMEKYKLMCFNVNLYIYIYININHVISDFIKLDIFSFINYIQHTVWAYMGVS